MATGAPPVELQAWWEEKAHAVPYRGCHDAIVSSLVTVNGHLQFGVMVLLHLSGNQLGDLIVAGRCRGTVDGHR